MYKPSGVTDAQLVMKFLLSCLSFVLAIGCTRRNLEYVEYTAVNNSGVAIKLVFASQTNAYAYFNSDGIKRTLIAPFYGISSFAQSNMQPEFALPPPVKVVFNDKDTVYHYNDSSMHTGKYLNKLSNRCLYNFQSYRIEKFKSGENGIYTFTPADYDFARQ